MKRSNYSRLILLVISLAYIKPVIAIQCEYILDNEWNTGFLSTVILKNNTPQAINGWSVEIEYKDQSTIDNIWNAELIASSPYIANNRGYNATIAAGQSISFGFLGTKVNTAVETPVLSGICSELVQTNGRPVAEINASSLSGSIPLTVSFDAGNSFDPEDSDLTYFWEFEDGTSSTSIKPEKTFEQAGSHKVTLTVSDGELESEPKTVVINAFDASTAGTSCEYKVVSEWSAGFTGSVKIANNSIMDVNGWQLSLQLAENVEIVSMWNAQYSGANPYAITSMGYNAKISVGGSIEFGFSGGKLSHDADVNSIQLGGICELNNDNDAPTAIATASVVQGDAPLSVTFDGTGSSDPNGDALTYRWNFGDGTTASLSNTTKIYTDAGEYTVSLVVNDGFVDSEPAEIKINVNEPAAAEDVYTLDTQRSTLYFVSTKKIHVVEKHHFTDLSGGIDTNGKARLNIDLNSVETGVDIRNERMREHLFETSVFSKAEVTLNIDLDELSAIPVGNTLRQPITPVINLHGFVLELATDVRVSRISDSTLLVQNISPVILQAPDFGFESGIDVLKDLAKLSSISHAVPTNFTLFFELK